MVKNLDCLFRNEFILLSTFIKLEFFTFLFFSVSYSF